MRTKIVFAFIVIPVAIAFLFSGCSGDDDPIGPGNPIVDTGTLSVTTVTTGESIDADGYTLLIDGSQSGSIGANETHSLPGLPVGPYLVALEGVATNCSISWMRLAFRHFPWLDFPSAP